MLSFASRQSEASRADYLLRTARDQLFPRARSTSMLAILIGYRSALGALCCRADVDDNIINVYKNC